MTSILAGIAIKIARSLAHIQVTRSTVRSQLPMLSVSDPPTSLYGQGSGLN